MNTRVWIGPPENAPSGWTVVDSLQTFLLSSTGPSPTQIVIDDRAAALRESDFERVYTHSPLARITRVVGPWRAGIGRTDPTWPLATTHSGASSNGSSSADEPGWLPLTSGYEDIAANSESAAMSGLAVSVMIRDPELREMWIDSLRHAGAELIGHGAQVLIHDGREPDPCPEEPCATAPAAQVIVHLCADPWNMNSDDSQEACPSLRGMTSAGSACCGGIRIAASILDAPAAVMHRVVQALKREPS